MEFILATRLTGCTTWGDWWWERYMPGVTHQVPGANGTKKNRAGTWSGAVACSQAEADYMWSIMTWPKPEQLTCVAPSIRRAKS